MLGLKKSTSRQQLLKICCYPVYEKVILRLAMLKELMDTVMICKKNPHHNPPALFQSVIIKSAVLTFPPVAVKLH